MNEQNNQHSLRTFIIIWGGQVASLLGSEITNFALTLWAWQVTGMAMPLSLIILFSQVPRVVAAFFAGVLVDRWNRKLLMMVGDTAAAISTIAILLLFLSDRLEIWHLYVTAAINGLFSYFQDLAYSASISVIVPKQHYTRAAAMNDHIGQFGSNIIAPALAGVLYYAVGLKGILIIDLVTFIIAISTVWCVQIPQPQISATDQDSQNIWQDLTFGFRYIIKRSSFLAILIFWLIFNLVDGILSGIHSPLILARSSNDAAVFASVQSAIGLGGAIGAVVLSVWGGFKRRIHGVLLGSVLSYASMMAFGRANLPSVWIISGFFAGVFWPFISSSNQAIWLSKVAPEVQGRVFATRYLMAQISLPLGLGIGGILADYLFEPAMMPGGSLAVIFGGVFGTGSGSGMALQYSLFSSVGVLIGLGGYGIRKLRDVEMIMPDHDVACVSDLRGRQGS